MKKQKFLSLLLSLVMVLALLPMSVFAADAGLAPTLDIKLGKLADKSDMTNASTTNVTLSIPGKRNYL